MSTEQIVAIVGTIVGAPVLIEFIKRWLEGRNLRFQSGDKDRQEKEEREWVAMTEALKREREVYVNLLTFERTQFALRLTDIEARLGKIQEEAQSYQKLYWEERVVRERLQARIELLEREIAKG